MGIKLLIPTDPRKQNNHTNPYQKKKTAIPKSSELDEEYGQHRPWMKVTVSP